MHQKITSSNKAAKTFANGHLLEPDKGPKPLNSRDHVVEMTRYS